MTRKEKTKRHGNLHVKHVLLTDDLLKKLMAEAKKEDRKASGMLRRILEERYQSPQ